MKLPLDLLRPHFLHLFHSFVVTFWQLLLFSGTEHRQDRIDHRAYFEGRSPVRRQSAQTNKSVLVDVLVNRRLAHELDLRRLYGVLALETELKRELFAFVQAAFRTLEGYPPSLAFLVLHVFHLELGIVFV